MKGKGLLYEGKGTPLLSITLNDFYPLKVATSQQSTIRFLLSIVRWQTYSRTTSCIAIFHTKCVLGRVMMTLSSSVHVTLLPMVVIWNGIALYLAILLQQILWNISLQIGLHQFVYNEIPRMNFPLALRDLLEYSCLLHFPAVLVTFI